MLNEEDRELLQTTLGTLRSAEDQELAKLRDVFAHLLSESGAGGALHFVEKTQARESIAQMSDGHFAVLQLLIRQGVRDVMASFIHDMRNAAPPPE